MKIKNNKSFLSKKIEDPHSKIIDLIGKENLPDLEIRTPDNCQHRMVRVEGDEQQGFVGMRCCDCGHLMKRCND